MTKLERIQSLNSWEMAQFLEEFLYLIHGERELVNYIRREEWLLSEDEGKLAGRVVTNDIEG